MRSALVPDVSEPARWTDRGRRRRRNVRPGGPAFRQGAAAQVMFGRVEVIGWYLAAAQACDTRWIPAAAPNPASSGSSARRLSIGGWTVAFNAAIPATVVAARGACLFRWLETRSSASAICGAGGDARALPELVPGLCTEAVRGCSTLVWSVFRGAHVWRKQRRRSAYACRRFVVTVVERGRCVRVPAARRASQRCGGGRCRRGVRVFGPAG